MPHLKGQLGLLWTAIVAARRFLPRENPISREVSRRQLFLRPDSLPPAAESCGRAHIRGRADWPDAASCAGRSGCVVKIEESWKSLLTLCGVADYIRLTNDGGHAADDEEVRF